MDNPILITCKSSEDSRSRRCEGETPFDTRPYIAISEPPPDSPIPGRAPWVHCTPLLEIGWAREDAHLNGLLDIG
ncbi:jg20800 [Pararge aegeria aegeria]|uniref:Jg20800 protein n=1 Tax=Pararge aegeria aegeria TaxID=348720 RepID=A0A8S4R9X5_9NEOP|nr:jg20800 [Pararge aegeria aegeria]